MFTHDHSAPVCLVRGRRFIQRGNQWLDEAVDHMPQARRVRVHLDSPQFFQLLLQRPDLLPNIAAARNIQLVLGDTIYEIYE